MKLGIFLGLTVAAVGGAAYAHKRRGGTLTMDSIKESLDLAKRGLSEQFNVAKDKVQELVSKAAPLANQAAVGASGKTDRFGYSEYTIAKNDRDMH